MLIGLNPCFSGTYSQSSPTRLAAQLLIVLILVLVEHTLREATDIATVEVDES